MQTRFHEETNFWSKVLIRLLDITITLAENNLAFRGHSEVVGKPQSGNFLALVDMLSKYDPVLDELLKKRNGAVKYLSPAIQNELIELVAASVKTKLLEDIRLAPFFPILADGTDDLSRQHQVSTVIRYVAIDDAEGSFEIKESFVGFHNLEDQSAASFTALLTTTITELGLDIRKC